MLVIEFLCPCCCKKISFDIYYFSILTEELVKVKREDQLVSTALSASTDSYSSLYQKSVDDPEHFWSTLASNYLQWDEPFKKAMDCNMEEGKIKWFTGGKLNPSGEY